MDTNAIICLSLTIVSNFVKTVQVAPEVVPRGTNDIETIIIGRQYFPLDVFLHDRRGNQFWIRHGVVCQFLTTNSYFTLQDPHRIGDYVGVAKLSSNEVFRLATTTMTQLLKNGNPLQAVRPVIKAAKPFNGQQVPFYDVIWPDPVNPAIIHIADIEVNAQSGNVVALNHFNHAFDDDAQLLQLSNLVFQTTFSPGRRLETGDLPPGGN